MCVTSIYVCVYVLITIIIKEEESINLGGSLGYWMADGNDVNSVLM